MVRAGQSAEDEVDDVAGVLAGIVSPASWLVARAECHPGDDGPRERVEQEIDGGSGGKFAPLDRRWSTFLAAAMCGAAISVENLACRAGLTLVSRWILRKAHPPGLVLAWSSLRA
jgi:hypothetical protein